MSEIDNLIVNKYGSSCVAYWPLTKDGVALVGGNNLVLTNVTFTNGTAYFNGLNASAITTSNLVLGTTNKITVVANIKSIYNTTASQMYFEHTANWFTQAGSFGMYQDGTATDDPVAIGTRGNVGASYSYYISSMKGSGSDNLPHFFAATYDYSLASEETNLYSDASLLTASSRPADSNNTGNFTDNSAKFYVGARASSSAFANMYISNLAIFSRILTVNEIKELYMAVSYNGYQSLPLYVLLDDGERKKPYRYGD